jgi:spore maturation protein CgeB
MKKRKELIESLLPLGIQTYGDPEGWKELMGKDIPTHPNIDYTRQIADTYNQIRIHINSTSCQMKTSVNQRVFDIPMAGSFVLTDHQKDMDDLFEIGKEAVCYENLEDLKHKITFYSKNNIIREKIVLAAQKRIMAEHTYSHRLESLLKTLS